MDITRKIANSKALTIVGGGDTDAALHKSSLAEKVDFVSTAGGAFLEMLGGAELPGVKSLER
jgi:phosphoglycerate kinase